MPAEAQTNTNPAAVRRLVPEVRLSVQFDSGVSHGVLDGVHERDSETPGSARVSWYASTRACS